MTTAVELWRWNAARRQRNDLVVALRAIADFEPDPNGEWEPREQIAIFARRTARFALAQADRPHEL